MTKTKTIAEKTAENCIRKVAINVLDQINWKGPYSKANVKDMIIIIQSAIDEAVENERDRIKNEVHELFKGVNNA